LKLFLGIRQYAESFNKKPLYQIVITDDQEEMMEGEYADSTWFDTDEKSVGDVLDATALSLKDTFQMDSVLLKYEGGTIVADMMYNGSEVRFFPRKIASGNNVLMDAFSQLH